MLEVFEVARSTSRIEHKRLQALGVSAASNLEIFGSAGSVCSPEPPSTLCIIPGYAIFQGTVYS